MNRSNFFFLGYTDSYNGSHSVTVHVLVDLVCNSPASTSIGPGVRCGAANNISSYTGFYES